MQIPLQLHDVLKRKKRGEKGKKERKKERRKKVEREEGENELVRFTVGTSRRQGNEERIR